LYSLGGDGHGNVGVAQKKFQGEPWRQGESGTGHQGVAAALIIDVADGGGFPEEEMMVIHLDIGLDFAHLERIPQPEGQRVEPQAADLSGKRSFPVAFEVARTQAQGESAPHIQAHLQSKGQVRIAAVNTFEYFVPGGKTADVNAQLDSFGREEGCGQQKAQQE